MTDPQPSLIATRLEFQEALRAAFIECARIGSREIWMCDEDFADWPLNDGALIDALTQWAMPHRKLTVLARDYDEMLRKHPRWVEWRRHGHMWSSAEPRKKPKIASFRRSCWRLHWCASACSIASISVEASREIRAIFSEIANSLMLFRNARWNRSPPRHSVCEMLRI